MCIYISLTVFVFSIGDCFPILSSFVLLMPDWSIVHLLTIIPIFSFLFNPSVVDFDVRIGAYSVLFYNEEIEMLCIFSRFCYTRSPACVSQLRSFVYMKQVFTDTMLYSFLLSRRCTATFLYTIIPGFHYVP